MTTPTYTPLSDATAGQTTEQLDQYSGKWVETTRGYGLIHFVEQPGEYGFVWVYTPRVAHNRQPLKRVPNRATFLREHMHPAFDPWGNPPEQAYETQ